MNIKTVITFDEDDFDRLVGKLVEAMVAEGE
mgnify:CR=1 FL=1